MNHFMDFDPRLIRERNELMRQEVRSVRLEEALRENEDQERKEERAGMKGTLGGFLGRIAIPTPAMVVVLLALLIATSGTAMAAISFTYANGNITACADSKTGVLRILQGTQSCTSKETPVNWVNGLQGSQVADSAKLDGKDASAFLGANQKAADAAHADSADHATTADSATHADSAGDADTLDGKNSTDFVTGTGTMTPVDEGFSRYSSVLSVPGAHIQAWCGAQGGTQMVVSPTSDVNSVRLWRDDGGADPIAKILYSGDSDSSPVSAADRVILQGSSTAGSFTAVLFTTYEDGGACYLSGYVLSAPKQSTGGWDLHNQI